MVPGAEETKPERAQDPPELEDEELDDVSGGVLGLLPEFRGRGMQPDGGGVRAHE